MNRDDNVINLQLTIIGTKPHVEGFVWKYSPEANVCGRSAEAAGWSWPVAHIRRGAIIFKTSHQLAA